MRKLRKSVFKLTGGWILHGISKRVVYSIRSVKVGQMNRTIQTQHVLTRTELTKLTYNTHNSWSDHFWIKWVTPTWNTLSITGAHSKKSVWNQFTICIRIGFIHTYKGYKVQLSGCTFMKSLWTQCYTKERNHTTQSKDTCK